jgi:1,4-dihydroxy-2-naphthoate octaprenyltransferase
MRIVRGVWLEIRVIPVLLWSYAALTVGSGLAFRHGHRSLALYAGALLLGVLIQGLVAHSTNEIVDWRSGTDAHDAPRVLSGGSKVVVLGLLGQRGMAVVLAVAFTATAALGIALAATQGWWLLAYGLAGVAGALAYSAPPVRGAYRPFAGEAIAFGCVVLCVTGAYRLQGPGPGPLELGAGAAVAAYAVGMLMMHHYLDREADLAAVPRKTTSIVLLGLDRGRWYAVAWDLVSLVAAAVSSVFEPRLLPLAAAALIALPIHVRCNPRDVASVTGAEFRVIALGIAGALAAGILLDAWIALAVIPAVVMVAIELALAPGPPGPEHDPLLAPPVGSNV